MDRQLLGVVGGARTLCLNVAKPGWDSARGYLPDMAAQTLYFPVSKKYLDGRNLLQYEVLIWSTPRLLAVGRLSLATSPTDIEAARRLAAADGLDGDQIDTMLHEQRHHTPRKNRHKLQIETLAEVPT